MAGGSAPWDWFQFCSGLEGLKAHVGQMAVGLQVWIGVGVSVGKGISVRVWAERKWVAELSQAGLQGVEALREDGWCWCGDGGSCGGSGGRGGQGLAAGVRLAVGESWLRPLAWTLHTQKPRDPLQQNQVHLADQRETDTKPHQNLK